MSPHSNHARVTRDLKYMPSARGGHRKTSFLSFGQKLLGEKQLAPTVCEKNSSRNRQLNKSSSSLTSADDIVLQGCISRDTEHRVANHR